MADYQLRIVDTWPVDTDRIDVRYELAWRDRQLMFQAGDTLADAVAGIQLCATECSCRSMRGAAALPVRGIFDASDPFAFAQTVAKISPVAVQTLAADTLLIRAE